MTKMVEYRRYSARQNIGDRMWIKWSLYGVEFYDDFTTLQRGSCVGYAQAITRLYFYRRKHVRSILRSLLFSF